MQNTCTLMASLPDLDNADPDDLETLIAMLQEKIRQGDEELAELEKQVTANAMHIAGLVAELEAWEQESGSLGGSARYDDTGANNVVPFPNPTSGA